MIIRAIDGLNETVGRIVSVVAIVFAAFIIYDVFMRYVLNDPTRWAFDVTKQMFGFYFVLLGGGPMRRVKPPMARCNCPSIRSRWRWLRRRPCSCCRGSQRF